MNLEEKVIGDITGNFIIEAYQRGYRWSEDEVKYLLNDIDEISDGQKYCLQPVVVKKNNDVYELIDGQQRMTTLYLVMKYLSTYIDLNYSIEYTTRKSENGHIGSRELLEKIDTIDLVAPSSNIDELFIKNSFIIIKNWFAGNKIRMMNFAAKLQKYVTIIWYEVDNNEDSVNIFTRLNIGKIYLTNAELIKALFLGRGKKNSNGVYANYYGINDKKQHEIALEWDAMEKELHDDKFWAFITNEPAVKYPIRMELLFDMIEMKPTDESNFYTFNRFYERFKDSTNKFETWEVIVRYYQQLREWYNDFNLYHQVGFLVACGMSVKSLLDMAMNEKKPLRKSEFREVIIRNIRKRMVFVKGEGDQQEEIDYVELNYESHKPYLHTLLLLFNVETIRQKGDENNRFPFERYKKQGNWSLEHIHAQNSESLKTARDWRDWLELHKLSLEEILKSIDEKSSEANHIKDVIAKMDQVIANIDNPRYKGSIRDEFGAITPAVVDILSDGDDKTQMHSLSNMALLTVGENAALNNSTFDVKRAKMIEMDKKGDYIPTCTKNVFMKYYSSSDTKLHFWSEEDRISYVQAMNDVLYNNKSADGNEVKLIKSLIRYGNE
ncbi:MAG: DUF262 domain-containing protein [Parabacteroides sp.]|uniref:DUF262 domain-containing protein n=1 Tax=Macellibacteroides sp. TaxID=2014584 RepID=UPI003E1E167E